MKIKRLYSITLMLILISSIFVFSSCEKDDEGNESQYNIVGVWTGHYYMPTGTRVDGTFCFNTDHTGTYERGFRSSYSFASFVWTIKGQEIHLVGKYADYDGSVIDFNRTIKLENGGTSFEYGAITFTKRYDY